jgi:polar amino acid transport system permease protein
VDARRRVRNRVSPRSATLLIGAFALSALLAGCTSATRGGYPFHWNFFFDSIIHPDRLILAGLALTVTISIASQAIGVILGVFAAIGRLSRLRLMRYVAYFYIWVFRGTPLIVQLVFFYYGLSVTRIYTWPDVTVGPLIITGAVQAGIFALGVNEGAYMAEIVRAGILSIDTGQAEAARALGMTYGKLMRRIVLPQAARVIIPPLGNEFNNMLKTTSLLFVLSVQELYTVFNIKQNLDFAPFEYFLAAAAWFLLLTTIWGLFQSVIERRFSAGHATPGGDQPGFMARMVGLRTGFGNRVSGGR